MMLDPDDHTVEPEHLLRVGRQLLKHEWHFAKTMADQPHWYTLRREWSRDGDFVQAVEMIRNHGYIRKYRGSRYGSFNINGMYYWTMGAPIGETILINRAYNTEPPPAPYDAIADHYDEAFADEASRAEDDRLFKQIGPLEGLRVLDIGCGTGLTLEYGKPALYCGIDPSAKMLARFKEKHPAYADKVICTPLESFVGTNFDLVLCLYGTANYITPKFVEFIPQLCRPGGRYVTMFFREGYHPVTYERTGVELFHTDGVTADLPGSRTDFNQFVLIDGVLAPQPSRLEQQAAL
jgi:2-polyprenyl-3-methyl-5-hydroxy-6-metoxy-1,4-benzoquinol methylase